MLDNGPEFLTSDVVGCCVVFETILKDRPHLAEVLDQLYLLSEMNSSRWKVLVLIER